MPIPRKLREASVVIAPPRVMLATMMYGAIQLRVMWWSMMRQSPAPMARAAVVYSISLTDSTCEAHDTGR